MDETTELSIEHDGGRIYVRDHPGRSPAIVAMHGFPDDSRIYDRLIGPLAPHRVVTFDWTGYGRSSRLEPDKFTAADRQREIRAVLDGLNLDRVVLLAHDAAGPEAIDFTVANPGRIAGLVLLNTYYGRSPNLALPEMIALMADPALAPLTDRLLDDPNQRLWLLAYTARRFGLDENLPPTVSGSSRSCRSSSETLASPTRSPKSGRGPAIFRRRSTGRTAQSHPAGYKRSRRGYWSPSVATTPISIPKWHNISAACSRTPSYTCSTGQPTGPSGSAPRWSRT